MKQLNKTQSVIFLVGGILMVIGAGCCSFMWHSAFFSFVFLLGSFLFAIMQCMQSYDGLNVVIKRLKRIMTVADLLFVLSGIIMVETTNGFMRNIFSGDGGSGYINYITYIYNKWVLLLLIAAILEVYTVHRISYELKKINEDDKDDE
jgi:uncharacterized membrane protein